MRVFESVSSMMVADMLAPEITLRLAGRRGIRTCFGVFMTVGYILTLSIFSVIIVLTYFDTSSPTVVQETAELEKNHRVDLGKSNLLPVVYLYLDELFNIKAEDAPSYFTIRFSKMELRTGFLPDGSTTIKNSKVDMDVIPCSQLKREFPELYSYYASYENDPLYKKLGLTYGLCIKSIIGETVISGGGSETDMDMLLFQVFPCSLADTSQCKPMSMAKRIAVAWALPVASLNMSNFEAPNRPTLAVENFYYINENVKQKFQPRAMLTDILDDQQSINNKFSGRTVRTSYFSIDRAMTTSNSRWRNPVQITCTPLEIKTLACNSFIQFEFMSSARKATIIRVYKSITRTLSEIGGINSFAFLLFYYVNHIYCSYAKKKILVNKIFSFFEESEAAKQEKRNAIRSTKKVIQDTKTSGSFNTSKNLAQPDGLNAAHPHAPPQTRQSVDILEHLDKKSIEALRNEAYAMIEESLDVVSIVREINQLKVLVHLLLKDYHTKLTPLMALQIHVRKTNRMKYRDDVVRRATGRNSGPGRDESNAEIDLSKLGMDALDLAQMTNQEALNLLRIHLKADKEGKNHDHFEKRVNRMFQEALEEEDSSDLNPNIRSTLIVRPQYLPFMKSDPQPIAPRGDVTRQALEPIMADLSVDLDGPLPSQKPKASVEPQTKSKHPAIKPQLNPGGEVKLYQRNTNKFNNSIFASIYRASGFGKGSSDRKKEVETEGHLSVSIEAEQHQQSGAPN